MIFLLRQTYYDSRNNDRQSTTVEVSYPDSRRSGPGKNEKGVRIMTEISSDVIRGYNDTMILFLLRKEPSYGYELSKMIKTLSDGKYIIKETTLYSAFTRMEKNGFVESFVQESMDTGKKRTYYRITEEGRRYYREKREEWLLTKEVVEKFITKENEDGND